MNESVIRAVNYDDLPEIMKIEREVFSDPWREEMFLQEIGAESAFLIELPEKKEIIGYICGLQILDEYMIMNIAVKTKEQHKGFGSKLLGYLLERIIKQGCKKCFLEVRAGNIKAVDFYKRYGFEIIGTRKEYYRSPVEDALVMKLDLPSES